MKTSLLTIIVGMIIASSVIFVAIWYSIPEECDEECEIERRRIGSGNSAYGTFDDEYKVLQKTLEDCRKNVGVHDDGYSLWSNQTHRITAGHCEIRERNNSSISESNSQYMGNLESYSFNIEKDGKHEIRLQSHVTEFKDVFYDKQARSIIIPVESNDGLSDTVLIYLHESSFETLLGDGGKTNPSDVFVLLDGEEQEYDVLPAHPRNDYVVWEFKNKSNTAEIELVLKPKAYREGTSHLTGFTESLSISTKQVRYDVFYNVTHAAIDDVQLNCDSASFTVSITPDGDGVFQLSIPNSMLGGIFMVMVNDKEWEDMSLDGNVLMVNFAKDTTTIDVLGTYSLGTGADDGVCDVVHNPPYSYILSPLMQDDAGIPIDEIQCKDNLVLIQKHSGLPACVKPETRTILLERGWAHDDSLTLDWKKHITVSASSVDKSDLKNIDHVVTPEDMQNVLLRALLYGADGCKNETEICKISGGISVSRTYPFLTSYISGNDMYSVTLTLADAEDLLSSFDWKKSENMLYSGIQLDEKYYVLILSTFENSKTPDVKMSLIGTTYEPISLERGKLQNYTIQVSTWATYGAPAQIDLRAVQGTKDSGIDVWVDPPSITVPERSNATSTLFIKAHEDANDGLYDVRVVGRANGNLADLYCRNTVCPTVNIGNSSWSIGTFGSGTNMGIGGVESLKDTFLELDLNKKEFFEDDIVEIKTYLVNNSTEKISFVPDRLLIKVIKAQDVGYYDNLYGIDAMYESDEPLVLEPHSKTLLVRPFYWNQNTFEGFDDEQRVDARQHKMIAKFVGDAYAWNDDIWFGVK